MKIRKLSTLDIPQLVQLNVREIWNNPNDWTLLTEEQRWSEGLWWADERLLAWYYSILQDSGGNILIAVDDDGKIVGELDYCQSYDITSKFEGYRYHIIWLLTHPERRREGIAGRLVGHLQASVNHPIWVEPEDSRSLGFYQKNGEVIHVISNWQLDITNIPTTFIDHRLEYEEMSLEDIYSIIDTHTLIIGRYYAPFYDILQLDKSEPVEKYMWGNTQRPEVFKFNLNSTEIYAIMTQYPRIWTNSPSNLDGLATVLPAIFLYLLELGYDSIFLQIYQSSNLAELLQQWNFTCTIEEDPVYLLNSL